MRLALAALLLVAGCVSGKQALRPAPITSSFSVLVERIPNGWAARCDSGCRWSGASLSFACRQDCAAVIDANGLVTVLTPRTEPSAFSIRLEPTAKGVAAEGRAGTTWKTLTWECASSSCPVRLDANGMVDR
jgi:hypothetical protein